MFFFKFDIRKVLIIVFIISIPFVALHLQKNPDEDPWFLKPISTTLSFLQDTYTGFTQVVRGTTSMYLNLIGIKVQNQKLNKENAELRAKLAGFNELKIKFDQLSKELDFKENSSMSLLAAKVIARDLSPDHASIRINRGSHDHVKKLQGVITVDGVVGYVQSVDYWSSQVMVLTDRLASIDAIVQRTRARGLLSGKTLTNCKLRYLERAGDVAPDDTIVTSGLKGYFPKGFPIGRITQVRKTDTGISQEAEVIPIVNPTSLEEVFVILDSGEETYSEQDEKGERIEKNEKGDKGERAEKVEKSEKAERIQKGPAAP